MWIFHQTQTDHISVSTVTMLRAGWL